MTHSDPKIIQSPKEIEAESMRIITEELKNRRICIKEENAHIIKRVIHTTADFDFAENLIFSEHASQAAEAAVKHGADIITDTNMTLAGISRPALSNLGCRAHCFMADPEVALQAKKEGVTRAMIAVRKAAAEFPGAVFAAGNAPTALIMLSEEIKNGYRPSLVIGVPVGFVNVIEAKEMIRAACDAAAIPWIIAGGRKGGSTVSCAVINAILYHAQNETDITPAHP